MDPTVLILDVQEKEVGSASAPSFPASRSGATGFPRPKKRSKFAALKQQQDAQTGSKTDKTAADPTPSFPSVSNGRDGPEVNENFGQDEKSRIDRENKARLDDMSPDEIAAAQRELFNTMNPALLQRLLKRANLDDAAPASSLDQVVVQKDKSSLQPPDIPVADPEEAPESRGDGRQKKTVSFAPVDAVHESRARADEDAPPAVPPADLFPLSSDPAAIPPTAAEDLKAADGMHFPRPAAAPDLDPDDPDFLQTLRDKYFPSLPADPSRLAWMAPLPTEDSPADRDSPYYPGQDSLAVSQLRFDFAGRLVPPRLARAIPVTRGLHHHGEAPEAAGYTVLELARLARSAVPAQRCVAFQTLGRVLYRLGRGEWGGVDAELPQGLWRCFSEGRVMESLGEAAAVEEGRGHRGSRAYALEAVWLAEKGGWPKKWAARLRLGR